MLYNKLKRSDNQKTTMVAFLKKKIAFIKSKYDAFQSNTVLIHIGKCGGSTIREEFKIHGIKFIEKHLTPVKFNPSFEYIIVIRNPIARFISAFNWRYKLVVEDQTQKNRFKGEKQLLEQFKNANDLAEALYNDQGIPAIDFQQKEFYIHHLKEDIYYYLGQFLSVCNPDQIKAVIATETLKEDLNDYFNINATIHEKDNGRSDDEYLSERAYQNLRKYFVKDYNTINQLYKMGLISENKYALLSK